MVARHASYQGDRAQEPLKEELSLEEAEPITRKKAQEGVPSLSHDAGGGADLWGLLYPHGHLESLGMKLDVRGPRAQDGLWAATVSLLMPHEHVARYLGMLLALGLMWLLTDVLHMQGTDEHEVDGEGPSHPCHVLLFSS